VFVVPRPVRNVPKKKLQTWEVIRLKASPAAFVGVVEAPDEQTALKLAIEQFKVRPADQRRLIVRPH
jgi:1,2-phenylacetyl-CoA epoxidase PaaB subunit